MLTDTAVYRLEEDGDPTLFILEARTPDHPALQLRDECALAGGGADNIRAFGSDKVEFGGRHNAIALAPETLDQPNRLGDRRISDFLTQHLDTEIQRLPNLTSLKDEVLSHLTSRLSDGVPYASEVAIHMGMSERTFYRRLADENLSYRDVLRDAQLSPAQDLLTESDCSIAEVAFLTCFSEQSVFSRAFKRWVGAAPAQFRQLSL